MGHFYWFTFSGILRSISCVARHMIVVFQPTVDRASVRGRSTGMRGREGGREGWDKLNQTAVLLRCRTISG